ncbi:hypothetical protein [Arachidicoccus rhizosphaerae]|uniref:hypothetical protein n=1 Tax=Arachidicoccus rhizosphaerae TaxID=551991 RepID=UPI001113ED10|nr:hypothetical protein [Arachidicoccus rhizosphaerae]
MHYQHPAFTIPFINRLHLSCGFIFLPEALSAFDHHFDGKLVVAIEGLKTNRAASNIRIKLPRFTPWRRF